MRWRKLGVIYSANVALHPKLATHAANPLPVQLDGDLYRVFYSGRDDKNRSSIGYVDIDMRKRVIEYIHQTPVFEHGSPGSFYSHGVSIGNCFSILEKKYILFMGWQCEPDRHWRGEIGRLRLDDDWSLTLADDGPFMALDAADPISLSYPWVMQMEDGSYKMWYGSTHSWDAGNGEMLHVINQACSNDGISWTRRELSLPYQLDVAQAFSRPTVIGNLRDGFHMWFSYRGHKDTRYRIGYASSKNGSLWHLRLADAGIDVSSSGWDCDMIEYPFVFSHNGEWLMLYNGNGYGKTGFGLAVLEAADK